MSAPRVKRRLQPLDLARIEQHHVKPAGWHDPQPQQVVPGRKDDAPLLGIAHAGAGAAVVRGPPTAHFHKHAGAIGRTHDEVDFAAATSWRSIIANQQPQSLVLQVAQGFSLRCVTDAFGGGPCKCRPGWF